MGKVTLAKHWSPKDVMYPPGSVVEVDDDTKRWLESCGAVAHAPAATEKPSSASSAREDDTAAEEKPAASTPAGGIERPARAASIDEWRKYAEAQGIVTKGLSKKEIIAATQ